MIVQSFGQLKSMEDPAQPTWSSGSSGNVTMYGLSQAYGQIYASQPNVRICIDFLARNIAQLGLPVYRRISDTDRQRLNDHDLAKWLSNPNPATTRYRLIEDLMTDLGIYFRAYWLKVRHVGANGRNAIGLVRLPPEEITVTGGLLPSEFVWTVNGREKPFAPSEIVHFSGYKLGISPLETLRRILAEEVAAGEHREQYWRNAGRQEGIIEQTADAPKWDPTQQQQFREQWQEFSMGGARAGMTAVLPKGMTLKQNSFSPKDSEYVQGGKLRREVCAAAYHIPQPMVGILEHATFSNVREQHKHLYQDTLGPWNEMITQEIERQLLIECEDQNRVYVEFNIDAKLAGSFEEQATALQVSTGRPFMTVNEARAVRNLPRIDDPELDTVAPQQGGPAQFTPEPEPDVDDDEDDEEEVDEDEASAAVIQSTRDRQHARLSKLQIVDRPAAFTADLDRWNRELATDLSKVMPGDCARRASHKNAETLRQLEADAMQARIVALEQHTAPVVARTP